MEVYDQIKKILALISDLAPATKETRAKVLEKPEAIPPATRAG
jgi:hypothetical protein